MKTITATIRLLLAFVLGAVGYALGFCVSILLATISTIFQISYVGGPLQIVQTTAAALGANFLGFYIFARVSGGKSKGAAIVFVSMEVFAAIMYGLVAILGGDWGLLTYPVLSCGLCAYLIYSVATDS